MHPAHQHSCTSRVGVTQACARGTRLHAQVRTGRGRNVELLKHGVREGGILDTELHQTEEQVHALSDVREPVAAPAPAAAGGHARARGSRQLLREQRVEDVPREDRAEPQQVDGRAVCEHDIHAGVLVARPLLVLAARALRGLRTLLALAPTRLLEVADRERREREHRAGGTPDPVERTRGVLVLRALGQDAEHPSRSPAPRRAVHGPCRGIS